MLTTIDFETYYDKKYNLKKMPIDLYIRDPQFKIHGVAIKVGDDLSKWYSGKDSVAPLRKYCQDEVLAHNTYFDLSILHHWYKISPKRIYDTMSMSRGVYGPIQSASLKELSARLGIGTKGDALVKVEGHRDITRYLPELIPYALNDVDLCYRAFNVLKDKFTETELQVIDIIVRMFTEPGLRLDLEILEDHLANVQQEKKNVLESVGWILDLFPTQLSMFDDRSLEQVEEILASNDKFSLLLGILGQKVPQKKSLNTGKQTAALSKKDVDFNKLLKSKDEKIAQAAKARLAIKSTIEESRTKNFLEVGKNPFPVQLMYYGSHTGRSSGGSDSDTDSGGRNPQNLPRNSPIKKAIIAPPGYVIADCDSAQIEARVLAWISGQKDLTEAFAKGEDVYSIFASGLYGYPVSKANKETKQERYVGKTSILGLGYGMGKDKFKNSLAVGEIPVDFTIERCEEIVRFYRSTYSKIPQFWKTMERTLDYIVRGVEYDGGVFQVNGQGVRLPNGLYIRYNNLEQYDKENGYKAYRYWGRSMGKIGWTDIYGGKATENLIQALARIIVTDQAVRISKRYKVVMFVHDAIGCLVPEKEAEEGTEWIIEQMKVVPSWARNCPVTAEGSFGKSYADCK